MVRVYIVSLEVTKLSSNEVAPCLTALSPGQFPVLCSGVGHSKRWVVDCCCCLDLHFHEYIWHGWISISTCYRFQTATEKESLFFKVDKAWSHGKMSWCSTFSQGMPPSGRRDWSLTNIITRERQEHNPCQYFVCISSFFWGPLSITHDDSVFPINPSLGNSIVEVSIPTGDCVRELIPTVEHRGYNGNWKEYSGITKTVPQGFSGLLMLP